MKKQILFPFVLFLMSGMGLLSAQLPYLSGDFSQAQQAAKKQQNMLLVFACAGWSPSCGQMSETTFKDPGVKDAVSNFVCWNLDMSERAPDDLPGKFRLTALPSYLLFDAAGNLVYSGESYKDEEDFLKWLVEAKDPSNHYSALKAPYASGERSPEFLQRYIHAMFISGEDVQQPVMEYLDQLPDEAYRKEENFNIMYYGLYDLNSRAYQYVLDNISFFRKEYGDEMADAIVIGAYQTNLQQALETGDQALFASVQEVSRKILPPADVKFVHLQEQMMFTEATEDWPGYAKAWEKRILLQPEPEWTEYNQSAWYYYLHIDEPAKLEKALRWAKRSIALNKKYQNLDTKACLLYKLGRNEEAKKAAELAIESGKQEGEDVSATQKLLEKLK